MTILLILDYLLNVVHSVGVALFIIGAGGLLFYPILQMVKNDFGNEDWRIPSPKSFIIILIIGLVMTSVPDKKLVFGVIAADYMIANTDVQELPPKAVAALNKYLDTYLTDNGESQ